MCCVKWTCYLTWFTLNMCVCVCVCVCELSCLLLLAFSNFILYFWSFVHHVEVGSRQLCLRISRCCRWSRLRWPWLGLFGIDCHFTPDARFGCLSRFISPRWCFVLVIWMFSSFGEAVFFPEIKPFKCSAHKLCSFYYWLSRSRILFDFFFHLLLKEKLI